MGLVSWGPVIGAYFFYPFLCTFDTEENYRELSNQQDTLNAYGRGGDYGICETKIFLEITIYND